MPLLITAQRGFKANYKCLRILIKFAKSSTFINTNHKMVQEFRNVSGIMLKFSMKYENIVYFLRIVGVQSSLEGNVIFQIVYI